MYSGPELPLTGGGLLVAGMTLTQYLWAAVALAVVGGALLTVANLAPRVALEPIPGAGGHRRLVLTINGRERLGVRGSGNR